MRRAYLPAAALVLPVVRSAVLMVVLFRVASRAEARESANAPGEAESAGFLVALPFFGLLCLELVTVVLVLWTARNRSRAGTTACVAGLSAVTLLIGALTVGSGYGYGGAGWMGVMVLVLLLPLLPAWLAVQAVGPAGPTDRRPA